MNATKFNICMYCLRPSNIKIFCLQVHFATYFILYGASYYSELSATICVPSIMGHPVVNYLNSCCHFEGL